ncbi:hypothetical protein WKH56_19700 [Priestia sp. SB1]|uniref:hypothetical protein n=1 Tax=Priestia sp. SB1 TaxID=3132359 RepID=UPI0031739A13
MGLQFRAKQKVIVEGKDKIGEISTSIMKETVDHNGEVVYEEKCYIKFEGEYSNWFPVEKLTLAIENMDYINPEAMKTIDYLCTDAHLDNKNFNAIVESAANKDML